jgi:hypothetical protein
MADLLRLAGSCTLLLALLFPALGMTLAAAASQPSDGFVAPDTPRTLLRGLAPKKGTLPDWAEGRRALFSLLHKARALLGGHRPPVPKVDQKATGEQKTTLDEPGFTFEGSSPCFNDEDAKSISKNNPNGPKLLNRDAACAAYCRMKGFEGVQPYGYKECPKDLAFYSDITRYSYVCANTSRDNWSPCYRDEDAVAILGVGKTRDDAGLAWCKGKGYSGKGAWRDCGNWYFSFQCN